MSEDKQEAARIESIRAKVRKFKRDKDSMTLGELLELTDVLADEWRDEQERYDLEKISGNCRACGRYRKGP